MRVLSRRTVLAALVAFLCSAASAAHAQSPVTSVHQAQAGTGKAVRPAAEAHALSVKGGASVVSANEQLALADEPAQVAKPITATIGKSILLRLDEPIRRVSIGNPNTADVTLITTREVYVLGKAVGATNIMLWAKSGRTTVVDITVGIDTAPLVAHLNKMLPDERDIRVDGAAGSVVLSGSVSSAVAVDQAVSIAEAFVRDLNRTLVLPVVAGDSQVASGTQVAIRTGATTGGGVGAAVNAAGARVVNLLRVREGQQVMLEVKVAEVNKTLLEKLGVDLQLLNRRSSGATFGIVSQFFNPTLGGFLGWANAANFIDLHAQRDDGLVKLLAEPNIVAISGQEASFLAGGTIFIPVQQTTSAGGVPTITLQERDFGVSLKFRPTVLGNGRINLHVQPEVSEPLQQGLSISTGGATQVLPAFASRRASTTVQLNDGQSLAIAGLIRNNWAQAVQAYPVLGELPVLGTLFRSTDWRNEKTELMFVITPRLVKPLPVNYALPTDNHRDPSRYEAFIGGKMEGRPPASSNDPKASTGGAGAGTPGGFDMRVDPAPAPAAPAVPTPTPPSKGGLGPAAVEAQTGLAPGLGVADPVQESLPGS